MPIIEVKIYDRRVTPESSKRMIEELTNALARACEDDGVKQHTTVIVQGVAPADWGVAGQQMS